MKYKIIKIMLPHITIFKFSIFFMIKTVNPKLKNKYLNSEEVLLTLEGIKKMKTTDCFIISRRRFITLYMHPLLNKKIQKLFYWLRICFYHFSNLTQGAYYLRKRLKIVQALF